MRERPLTSGVRKSTPAHWHLARGELYYALCKLRKWTLAGGGLHRGTDRVQRLDSGWARVLAPWGTACVMPSPYS